METDEPISQPTVPRWTITFLNVVGWSTVTAFLAAVMPDHWIQFSTTQFGFEAFPQHPVAEYLARQVSLFYGIGGVWILYLAMDLRQRYALLLPTAMGVLLLGIGTGIVDTMAEMPIWWTLPESLSTIIGAGFLWYVHHAVATATKQA